MSIPWPSTLQDKVNTQGFNLEVGDTAIRSDVDVGPVKVRRRFTRGIDKMSVTINLTESQFEDLEFFFKTTLNGGVNVFEWTHPITGTAQSFRFIGPPKYTPLGGIEFSASFELEIMPNV